jgi:hypothetical protein
MDFEWFINMIYIKISLEDKFQLNSSICHTSDTGLLFVVFWMQQVFYFLTLGEPESEQSDALRTAKGKERRREVARKRALEKVF